MSIGDLSGSWSTGAYVSDKGLIKTKRNVSELDVDYWLRKDDPLGSGAVSFSRDDVEAKKFATSRRQDGSSVTVPADFDPNYSDNADLRKAFNETARGAVFEVKGFNTDVAWSANSLEKFFKTGDPTVIGLKRGFGYGPQLNNKPYTERFSRPLKDLQDIMKKGSVGDVYVDAYKGFGVGIPREQEILKANLDTPSRFKRYIDPGERTLPEPGAIGFDYNFADGLIPNLFPMQRMKVPSFVETISRKIQDAGGRAQIVGGAPRDHLMGVAPKDWDIEVFGLGKEKLQKVLSQNANLSKEGLIGKDFGVFKTSHKGEEFEFTMPRRETKTGQKHTDFDIDVDPFMSVEEAAKRRDLTVNTIA